MDDTGGSSASNANAIGTDPDSTLLDAGRKNPGRLTISTATEESSIYRGKHSRDSSIQDYEVLQPAQYASDDQNRFLSPNEPKSPKGKGLSPTSDSAVSSLLRRMTTVRSPITGTKFRTLRRPRGAQYENLGEGPSGDAALVDLSSLEGLGYEMRDMSHVPAQQFGDIDTEYVSSPPYQDEKPDFQSFVTQRRSVGDGLKNIGTVIRRNPTRRPAQGQSSREAPSSAVSRSRTIRDVGKKLAREKNEIVVVNEAVDLSFFEGHEPVPYRSSRTFEDISASRQSTIPQETQSYFFPSDPDIPNWKPFSMSMWWIGGLTLLAFGLAGLQEALFQKSESKKNETPPSGLLAFNMVADISTPQFFAWKYLPTMLTIIYAVLLSVMDFDIRRLEPYYQLSQASGATAAASLNLDHLTMFQYFIPFKAVQLRQWAVFLSTTANIIASVAAPAIQNPSLNFYTNKNPDCLDGDRWTCENEKHYWVRMQYIWSRVLSASYLVIALILIILMIQLRRKSGLLSDPKGIAGIASMATRSHILRDFNGLDQANKGRIHDRLQHRRFVLYKSAIWQGEYDAEMEEPIHETKSKLTSPHPPMLRLSYAYPFVGFMVVGLVAIPLISLTRARAVPNNAPWLPILLATILKLLFNTFEADVRLMEPFYILSKGNALPEHSLTLDYQATVYGWMPFRAAMNHHWLVALVGLASVALDVLTVTIGSFSVDSATFLHKPDKDDTSNQDETFISFWVSLVLSFTILIFVILVTTLVYWQRRHPFLPREPATIAAVLAFIYASNMLTDFIDTERLNSKEMERKLKSLGKRYGLGWFKGRDEQIHCAIDEEPMRSRYVHGKTYMQAEARPLTGAETFYSV